MTKELQVKVAQLNRLVRYEQEGKLTYAEFKIALAREINDLFPKDKKYEQHIQQ